MAYEDIYIEARKAERAALDNGADATVAYAVWFAKVREVVTQRIAKQDREWAEARRARLAADRLLYEGRS